MFSKTKILTKEELIILIQNSEDKTFTVGVYDEYTSEDEEGCLYDYEMSQDFKKDDIFNFISEIKIVK